MREKNIWTACAGTARVAGLAALALALCGCAVEPERTAEQAPVEPVPAPAPAPAPAAPLPFLRTQGTDVVDEDGNVVLLRGCNVGGWLLLEPWIAGLDHQEGIETEKDVWDVLGDRLGKEAKQELIRTYRETFFDEGDVARIAGLGLNAIRVPVWWRATDDPAYGGDLAYLDRCLDWCARHGVYMIIDLQGAPGGQAAESSNVGEFAGGGRLWKNDRFKRETVAWWERIAERYKDASNVAAYDLLNEGTAMADYDDLVRLYHDLYRAIRPIDPRHILVIEDVWGFHRLPRPADMGWSNVVYSFHFYPGTPEEGFDAGARTLHRFHRTALHDEVPIYVGEFNTILTRRGGTQVFQRWRDIWEYYGWSWTFWTYKKVEDDRNVNWGVVGYYDERPVPDLRRDPLERVLAGFRELRTDRSREHPLLRAALAAPSPWVAADELPAPAPGARLLTMREAFVLPAEDGTLRMEWGYGIPNAGFWKKGDTVGWRFSVEEDGVYEVGLRMANDLDTNRVRAWIDGVLLWDVPVASTHGWRRYELRTLGRARLAAGRHTLELGQADAADQFVNVQYAWVRPLVSEPTPSDEKQVRLTPLNIGWLRPGGPVRVEWLNDPPNIAQWRAGEKIGWSFTLNRGGRYAVRLIYATPSTDTHLTLAVDGKNVLAGRPDPTPGWQAYADSEIGTVDLAPGAHELTALWEVDPAGDVANLREIRLERLP